MMCHHCESAPGTEELGLCPACHRKPQVRVLYLRRLGWTPLWEQHIQRLAARAKAGLPIFAGPRRERLVPTTAIIHDRGRKR